jgi:hypothetical protein
LKFKFEDIAISIGILTTFTFKLAFFFTWLTVTSITDLSLLQLKYYLLPFKRVTYALWPVQFPLCWSVLLKFNPFLKGHLEFYLLCEIFLVNLGSGIILVLPIFSSVTLGKLVNPLAPVFSFRTGEQS